MTSISSMQPKNHPFARRCGPDRVARRVSLVGLLTHCVALLTQGEPSRASLRFALIVSVTPLAALAALRFIGNADELVR
jgi:hypothetical protein